MWYGFNFGNTFPDPELPRLHTHWRRKGESMSWEVVETKEDSKEIVLKGPDGRSGKMTILVTDLAHWERA